MLKDNEPSLETIDDYDGKESPEKRKTVRFIILALILVGIVYSLIKTNSSEVSDYIGTPEKPGMDVTKGK
jgi:hypothetical protein